MAGKHCTAGASSLKRERRGKDKIQPALLNAAFIHMVSKQPDCVGVVAAHQGTLKHGTM